MEHNSHAVIIKHILFFRSPLLVLEEGYLWISRTVDSSFHTARAPLPWCILASHGRIDIPESFTADADRSRELMLSASESISSSRYIKPEQADVIRPHTRFRTDNKMLTQQ